MTLPQVIDLPMVDPYEWTLGEHITQSAWLAGFQRLRFSNLRVKLSDFASAGDACLVAARDDNEHELDDLAAAFEEGLRPRIRGVHLTNYDPMRGCEHFAAMFNEVRTVVSGVRGSVLRSSGDLC